MTALTWGSGVVLDDFSGGSRISQREAAKSKGGREKARGRQGRAPPLPGGPNSFIFMQFSAKNQKNNRFLGVGAPSWGKSWIRHCNHTCGHCFNHKCEE